MTDRSADPDELLAKGWHLSCYSYVKHPLNRDKPGVREYRLLLVNGSLERKLFGFGKDFAEALANAAGQV